VEWSHLAQDRDWGQALVSTVMNLRVLVPRSWLVGHTEGDLSGSYHWKHQITEYSCSFIVPHCALASVLTSSDRRHTAKSFYSFDLRIKTSCIEKRECVSVQEFCQKSGREILLL
jgi:hypothetical protein